MCLPPSFYKDFEFFNHNEEGISVGERISLAGEFAFRAIQK